MADKTKEQDIKKEEKGMEEEKQEQVQLQQKQLRRIAERGQIPTDKTELIEYLSTRIKQAQQALADTEQLLDQEVKEREKLAKSLQERNNQLNKLYEVDQKGLPEKIKEKLNDILSETVTQKIESQEKLQEQKNRNYQFRQRYEEIKWQDKNNKAKLQQQNKKEEQIAKDLSELQAENATHEEELKNLQTEFSEIRDKKQTLQNKYLQMKVALDRMNDIKGVLNRFFGNEDLWDEKMDLKEQKIQRLPQPAKEVIPPSRQKNKQGNSRLKPISKPTRNDDDDFWRADFKTRT